MTALTRKPANTCAIVMYHYVRDLANSRYPGLKGLDLSRFRQQLDYLQSHHAPVSAQDIHDCLHLGKPLPERACLLTFDDGYLEHFTEVFPELRKRGLSACFYPPVLAVDRSALLNVNKIHLLLAKAGASGFPSLLAGLQSHYLALRSASPDLPDYADLWQKFAKAGRFDRAEVIFFKRMLQHVLPERQAAAVLDALWQDQMDIGQKTAARELYLSKEMLAVMAANGMHIGAHGATHRWLDKLDAARQEEEIRASLSLLAEIHAGADFIWSVAYPFGGVNASLEAVCAGLGASFGLTTAPEVAEISPTKALRLPRLDTNDIKIDSDG